MATTVWKGHLTFGLVSIPVRLFKAARPEKISFHQLRKVKGPERSAEPPPEPVPISRSRHPQPAPEPEQEPETEPAFEPETYTRVRQQLVAPGKNGGAQDTPVARNEIVKGYEYDKNRYVVIAEDDLKQLVPKTATEMQIAEFVQLAEVDPVYYETSYYMAPDEAGEKPYALLFAAMKQSGFVALAEVAMHRREHVMLIRPGSKGLIAHTMYYATEIRSEQEYRTDTSLVNPRELEMATHLIAALTGPFEPARFKNKYLEKLQAMIDARLAGKEVAAAPPTTKAAPVVDIMEALKESLKQIKKPPASAPAAPAAKRRRTARG